MAAVTTQRTEQAIAAVAEAAATGLAACGLLWEVRHR